MESAGGGAVQLFFGSAGRIGRAPFWAAAGTLVALFWLYERLVHGFVHLLTAWLVELLLVFSASCVLSKRLHDRSRAGWWAALVLLAFVFAWPAPRGALGWLGAAGLLVAAVELGLRPGAPGPNRFGPPADVGKGCS